MKNLREVVIVVLWVWMGGLVDGERDERKYVGGGVAEVEGKVVLRKDLSMGGMCEERM